MICGRFLNYASPAGLCVLLFLTTACGAPSAGRTGEADASRPAPPGVAPAPTEAGRPRIVVLGDSLTAGLGLPSAQSYPSLLQKKIEDKGLRFEVVNAGISGDTSAGGLRRLDWALDDGNVRVLIVALGANDGLRGLPVAEMKQNLERIIEAARAKHIDVILAGMEAPPNYGLEYSLAFHRAFQDLARERQVPMVPFLLTKVAGDPSLNQADGIHPNAAGAAIVADNVWAVLQPVLERIPAS
jgi:acyl-CoA thioesterase I